MRKSCKIVYIISIPEISLVKIGAFELSIRIIGGEVVGWGNLNC